MNKTQGLYVFGEAYCVDPPFKPLLKDLNEDSFQLVVTDPYEDKIHLSHIEDLPPFVKENILKWFDFFWYSINSHPYKKGVDYLGAGFTRILSMLNQIFNRKDLLSETYPIYIHQPERSLSLSLQRKFISFAKELSKEVPVIIQTTSPEIIVQAHCLTDEVEGHLLYYEFGYPDDSETGIVQGAYFGKKNLITNETTELSHLLEEGL